MIKNWLLNLGLCIVIASCGSIKPTTKTLKSGNSIATNKEAYNKYFDADKARINGELAKAKEGYLNAIALDENNDAANYYLAKLLLKDNEPKQALPYIKKAVELKPDNNYYNELYADVLIQSNAGSKAIDIYKSLAKKDVKLAEKYLNIAAFYQNKLAKYDDALETMNELEKYYGVSPELSFRKIKVLKNLKRNKEVIREVDQLIKEEPNELKYYLLKIEVLEDAKMLDEARQLEKKIEIDFVDDYRLMPSLTMRAFALNDTVKYLSLLNKSIENKSIEPEEKAALLFPLLKLTEKDTIYNSQLISLSKKILAVSPNDEKAISIYATVLYNTGKMDEASKQYQKLINKEPNDFDNWRQLMFAYLDLRNGDSLETVSKRAMDYFPNQGLVYFMNGSAHQINENFDKAIKQFNKTLDYAEGNNSLQTQVYSTLGDLYNSKKQYKLSDSCFEKALTIVDSDATTLNNYAYFLSLRKEKLLQAEKMSKRSLSIRPKEKSYLDTYAWILFVSEKYAEAEKAMKQALDAPGENDVTMLEHYGDILFKLNDKNRAIEYWNKAKQKGGKSDNLMKKIATGQFYE